MTIEAINNQLDSLGANTAVLVPSDITCHAFSFLNPRCAAEAINTLNDYWTNKDLDTEYSFTSIGKVEVWDKELLCHCIKDCYRIDAVNDLVLKFFNEMQSSEFTKD